MGGWRDRYRDFEGQEGPSVWARAVGLGAVVVGAVGVRGEGGTGEFPAAER